MVKYARVLLTDDIDGVDGAETITFGLDGQTWEIDLAKTNRDRFTRMLAPYVAVARYAPDPGSAGRTKGPADSLLGSVHARGPDHVSHAARRARVNATPGKMPPVPSAAPSATTDIYDVADRLWETADELRANSHLKAAEYSIPVLGLIFLKFADSRFTQVEAELAGAGTGRRVIGKADYQARGVLYLPEQSRYAKLLRLTEGVNLGKAINDAMAAIEEENPALRGVLPRTYQSLTNATLVSLLRSVNAILGDIEGDAFGKVYEYFLGKFAVAEGAKGGEYFTPTSIVRLIVEIIEPFSGTDPRPGVRLRRHVRPERPVR